MSKKLDINPFNRMLQNVSCGSENSDKLSVRR